LLNQALLHLFGAELRCLGLFFGAVAARESGGRDEQSELQPGN
jgi:hypothetical protein